MNIGSDGADLSVGSTCLCVGVHVSCGTVTLPSYEVFGSLKVASMKPSDNKLRTENEKSGQ